MQPLALWLFLLACCLSPCLAQATHDPLIGAVRTPDGKPVAGVKVEAWRACGRGTGLLDLDYKNTFTKAGVTPTDRRGGFALQLPIGLPCRIVVDHPPYAIWLREDCVPGDELPIHLEVPAVVTGTLTLADGTPATAKLRAWHRDTHDEVLRGRTDEQGHYRFDRVAAGPVRIEIAPDHAPSPAWLSVDLESGKTLTHDVRLAAGVRLLGRVTDQQTGEPIVGARIGEGWTLHREVTTDKDGRYELRGYGSGGYDELHCLAVDHVKQVWKKPAKLADPCEQNFVMPRGLTASGRVIDGGGKAMPYVYVQVFATTQGQDQFHDCIPTYTDAGGRFHTSGLREDLDHVLVVRKDGFAMLVYALPLADGNGVKHAGDIVMSKPRIVRGVVTDAGGRPLANTAVNIWGYNQDRQRLDPQGNLAKVRPFGHYREWGLLDMYVGSRRGRTDHLGRFAFGDIPAGTFHLVVYGQGNARLLVGEPFEVRAGRDLEPVRLVTDQ